MPGGLNEMVLVGGAMGGDARLIGLTHGARVMLVVFVLVFGFRFFGDYHPSGGAGAGQSILHFPSPTSPSSPAAVSSARPSRYGCGCRQRR